MNTPVVLVHGMWHGSWCWSLVTEELAGRGIPSVAVDLDGHGLKHRSPKSRWARPFDPHAYATEPAADPGLTVTAAAETLESQLMRIGGGTPVVLVAHSMGGVVATAVAERNPDLIAELVYVAAFVPVTGPAGYYLGEPENAGERIGSLLIADPAQIGALRLDLDGPDARAAAREVLYHDVDEVTAEAAVSLLGPDGPPCLPTEFLPLTAERFGSVPHTYVVCTQDRAVPPALQRRLAREIDAVSAKPTRVVDIDSSHSPFLSRPGELAGIIAVTA